MAVVLVACGQTVTTDAGTDGTMMLADAGASWSPNCLGRTTQYASCDQYCATQNKKCSATCVTSRGYPNLAAEAWLEGQNCNGPGSGQQTCNFMWDDDAGGPPRWRCCCN
jgi:hypothetical protein